MLLDFILRWMIIQSSISFGLFLVFVWFNRFDWWVWTCIKSWIIAGICGTGVGLELTSLTYGWNIQGITKDCAICFQHVSRWKAYEKCGDCNRVYHSDCANEWKSRRNTCPTCQSKSQYLHMSTQYSSGECLVVMLFGLFYPVWWILWVGVLWMYPNIVDQIREYHTTL